MMCWLSMMPTVTLTIQCQIQHSKAILSYPIDQGHLINFVVLDFGYEHQEEQGWIVLAKREVLGRLFIGWGQNARDLLNSGLMASIETSYCAIPCFGDKSHPH